jgi:hypothetical protein
MRKNANRAVALALSSVVLVSAIGGGAARAEVPAAVTTLSEPTERTTFVPPNWPITAGGIAVFAGAYVPSVIVAIANTNPHDNWLYLPLAGPWIDLGIRPACGNLPGQTNCARASTYAGLLIVDGIMQTLGVIGAALGAVTPERRTYSIAARREERPSVRLVPASIGRGYGVAAFGKF